MRKLKILQGDCGLCDLCAIACSTVKFGVQNPQMSVIKVRHRPEDTNGRPTGAVDVLPCWHCDDPPCLPACPYDAMLLDEHNVVSIILTDAPEGKNVCVSCMKCVRACEEMHGVASIFISPTRDRPVINKSGKTTMRRTLYKCDCCGGDPACAKICPRDAIVFVEE